MSVVMMTGRVGVTSTRSSLTRATCTSVSIGASIPLSARVAASGRTVTCPTSMAAKVAGSSAAVTTAVGYSATWKKISRIRSSRTPTPVLTEASAISIRAVPSAATVPLSRSKRLASAISPAFSET